MIYRCFVIMGLTVLLSIPAFAEAEIEASEASEASEAEDEHALDPQYMFTEASDDEAAENKQIVSTMAAGETQTTFIDNNGNLKMQEKDVNPASSAEPKSLQSMPPVTPPPNTLPNQPAASDGAMQAPGGGIVPVTPDPGYGTPNTMPSGGQTLPSGKPYSDGSSMAPSNEQYPVSGQNPYAMAQPGGQYPAPGQNAGAMMQPGTQYPAPAQNPYAMTQPGAQYPVAGQNSPAMVQPGAQYPAAGQNSPAMVQPGAQYPVAGQNSPAMMQPGAQYPVPAQNSPGMMQPGAQYPVTGQNSPAMMQPGTSYPVPGQNPPAMTQPGGQYPVLAQNAPPSREDTPIMMSQDMKHLDQGQDNPTTTTRAEPTDQGAGMPVSDQVPSSSSNDMSYSNNDNVG